jgi:membrane protease YdiL (CAAX protease family)
MTTQNKTRKQNLILGIVLFALGLLGILSTLTMELPIPEETMETLLQELTPQQIKLVTLIQPLILLIVAIVIGLLLHKKVNLQVPIIEGCLDGQANWSRLEILKFGILGGIFTGILLTVIGYLFYPYLPVEFMELGKKFRPTLAVRFLYGGFTEEIIFRFGLMTFLVWVASKFVKQVNAYIYWVGILASTILFSMAHLPVLFSAVDPSTALMVYHLIGTSIGGIIFGWLYWQKGLESAFIAHICSHIVIVLGEPFIG